MAGVLELLAAAVERRDGERAEGGRGRDRARLVHVAREHRARALEQRGALGLAARGGRLGRGRGAVAGGQHVGLRDAAGGAGALHAGEVDAVGGGDAGGDRRDLVPSGHARRVTRGARRGGLGGRGRGCGRGRGAPAPALMRADHLADRHGVAGVGEDLGQRPGGGGGDLGVHLVGGDLDDRLVRIDRVAGLLGPLEHGALGDRLAHRGHRDVDRLLPRPGASGSASAGGASAAAGRSRRCRRRRSERSRRAARRRRRCRPRRRGSSRRCRTAGAGTSASTLSVEISTRVSSSVTSSPSCLCHSRMVPSETDSPIAGMTTSTVVLTAIWYLDHTAAGGALTAFLHDEADAARERPEPAHHGHHHAEPERDDPAPHGVDAEQGYDDPSDPVRASRRCASPGCPRSPARSASGRSAECVNERYLRRLKVIMGRAGGPCARAAGRPRPGQAPTSRGHHACSSCSGSRADLGAAAASHAWPTSMIIRFGRHTSASTAKRSGSTPHSSSSSRVSVSVGSSPTSTAPPAPSAQRPAHVATQGARRPASQRPSASRTTHSAASEADASSRTSRSDQRMGCSSMHSPPSAVSKPASRAARPSCEGEPRSASAAIAASAACSRSGGGSERILAPAHLDLAGLPGTAREDAGGEGHRPEQG